MKKDKEVSTSLVLDKKTDDNAFSDSISNALKQKKRPNKNYIFEKYNKSG